VIDSEDWPTVEHYYQAQKSANPEYKAAIRAAIHPGLAKPLAAPPFAPRRISQNSWFPQASLACGWHGPGRRAGRN
jgi:predicted NAD-dependent protein-ADP-ribosyltransferase YbiA (DUF1768 family)